MTAVESTSPHQFKEMHESLQEGGFTYNPRSRKLVEEGFSVAVHPEATMEKPHGEMGENHLEAYTMGSAPTWAAPGATEHIGGWKRPTEPLNDVLDLPQVHPPTGEGESAARQATIEHRQEAYSALHRGFTDVSNPFHPSTALGQQFPEFSGMSPEMQLEQPEIQGWINYPRGAPS